MTGVAFSWDIDRRPLVCRSLAGLSNVFVAVSLTVTGTRGNFSFSRMVGMISLAAPNPASFKPYEETTPEDVIAWAKAMMGEATGGTAAEYEAMIEERIAAQEAEAADLAAPIPMDFYVPPPPEEALPTEVEPEDQPAQ